MYVDGAHTATSLSCATQWFATASARDSQEGEEGGAEGGGQGSGATRCVRVLLFNTTGGRSNRDLLSPLVAQGESHRRLFDVVLFVPNDSSLDALPSSAAGAGPAPLVDYSWQAHLLQEWARLVLERTGESDVSSELPLASASLSQVEALVIAAGEEIGKRATASSSAAHRPAEAPLRARVVESIRSICLLLLFFCLLLLVLPSLLYPVPVPVPVPDSFLSVPVTRSISRLLLLSVSVVSVSVSVSVSVFVSVSVWAIGVASDVDKWRDAGRS